MSKSFVVCRTCGAEIECDSELLSGDAAVCCPHCGTTMSCAPAQAGTGIDFVPAAREPVAHDRSTAEALLKKAEALLFLKEFSKARATFQQAIHADPADWRTWFGMVEYYTDNLKDFSKRKHLYYLEKARAAATGEGLKELNATYALHVQKQEDAEREEREKPVGALESIKREVDAKWAKRAQSAKKTAKMTGIIATALAVVIGLTALVLFLTEDMRYNMGVTRANTYTCTYSYVDENGQTVEKTASFLLGKDEPVAPQKAGFVFAWYTAPDCNKESRYRFDTRPPEKNFRLYTRWLALYLVSFNTNGGQEMPVETVEEDSEIEARTPVKTGAKFAGWFKDEKMTQKAEKFTVKGNTTLYAKWVGSYTITFETNGGSTIKSITQDDDKPLAKPKDPQKSGTQFAGWYTSADFLGEAVSFPYSFSGNLTLYARWALRYNIYYHTNGATEIRSDTADAGAAYTPKTPDLWPGHIFEGWFADNTFSSAVLAPFTVIANTDLYAKWSRAQMFNGATVSAGERFSLSLDESGSLWAFGYNGDTGRYGNGSNKGGNVPVRIHETLRFLSVSAGKDHTVAIDTEGNLWAWGSGGNGRLGSGDTKNSNVPIMLDTGETKFSFVSAGKEHSLAIDTEGNLWAWGNGGNGRLGSGDTRSSIVPIQLHSATTFTAVSAGGEHSLAIDAAGNLWTWGNGNNGRLGNGITGGNQNVPAMIENTPGFTAISAGNEHSLAIDNDGCLWSFGNGGNGRLGLGNQDSKNAPAPHTGETVFVSVAAGWTHSLATDRDGNVWAFGSGDDGRLGGGITGGNKLIPQLSN